VTVAEPVTTWPVNPAAVTGEAEGTGGLAAGPHPSGRGARAATP
jgi:hypothetical protein